MSDELNAAGRSLSAAIDAVLQQEWGKLEQALVEVQGRVGRLLRELELQRGSPPTPPSPARSKNVSPRRARRTQRGRQGSGKDHPYHPLGVSFACLASFAVQTCLFSPLDAEGALGGPGCDAAAGGARAGTVAGRAAAAQPITSACA